MYDDWMKDMPLIFNEEDTEKVKLSLKDRFAIWLLNLGKERK